MVGPQVAAELNGAAARDHGRAEGWTAGRGHGRPTGLILRVFDREEGPEPRLTESRAGQEAKEWLRSAINGWAQSLRKGFEISNRAS
ncbi:MAG: hypothetical protein IPQ17_11635 [Xanthomonadales bacterium]|nr:hypothetical protein [Xanthomonadales bacterium]